MKVNSFQSAMAVLAIAGTAIADAFSNELTVPPINISEGRSDKWVTTPDAIRIPDRALAGKTPEEVLGTLIHEMVHLEGARQGKETKNKYNYHNKAFKSIAEKVFKLKVSKEPQTGFSKTELTEESQKVIDGIVAQGVDGDAIEAFEVPANTAKKTYTRFYSLLMDEADLKWANETREALSVTQKEFSKLLREAYVAQTAAAAAASERQAEAAEETSTTETDEQPASGGRKGGRKNREAVTA